MNSEAKIVSKVRVLNSNAECYDSIMSVPKSNMDLGAFLWSECQGGSAHGANTLAREIDEICPVW